MDMRTGMRIDMSVGACADAYLPAYLCEDIYIGSICIGSISASPTACPLRGCGRAATPNDRLSEAVILSTGTPISTQCTCRRRWRHVVMARIDMSVGVCADVYMSMRRRGPSCAIVCSGTEVLHISYGISVMAY